MLILVPREVAKTLLILCGIVVMLAGIGAVIFGRHRPEGQRLG